MLRFIGNGIMRYGESDTRAKLIDPAIHSCGWTEDLIRREETAGAIEIIDGKPRKRAKGRVEGLICIAILATLLLFSLSLLLRFFYRSLWLRLLRRRATSLSLVLCGVGQSTRQRAGLAKD